MVTLSLERILIDGLLLVSVVGVIILGSLYFNPRLWLQDYPKAIRAKVPPNTPQEKRIQIALMLVFLTSTVAILYFSGIQLKAANGGSISFFSAWLHAYILFNIVNLFDAVGIDYLILMRMMPQLAVLPGTTLADHAIFNDWRLHVRNYLKGVVIGAVFSLPIAFAIVL